MLAWACDRPIKWCSQVQKWVRIMLKSCCEAMQSCMPCGSENHPNGTSHCTHVQVLHSLAKLGDFSLFRKVRSRGTTFMLNTFPFEAWIMMNFEVEVWEIKHIWKFSKSQVKCSLLPPWITFSMDFKWERFLHKNCSSFNLLKFGHKFDLIWIWHEGVMHFRSWGKSLVQW